jgi:CRP-like cAMP-binding protein
VLLRESELAFMPRATFMALLDRNLSFNRFIIDQLNERLGQFVGLAQRDRLLEPNARVALSLGSLYNRLLSPGIESALVISQDEIAELAGLSRQRTNEALKFLEAKGLVRVQRVGLTILDLEGLQNFKS